MSETPVEHAVYELMTIGACQSECDDLIAAVRAEEQAKREALVDEIETLCQAIQGHRAGGLNNDGLWHYHQKARAVLAQPCQQPKVTP